MHPERYKLVERMAKEIGSGVAELVGNSALVDSIVVANYLRDEVAATRSACQRCATS